VVLGEQDDMRPRTDGQHVLRIVNRRERWTYDEHELIVGHGAALLSSILSSFDFSSFVSILNGFDFSLFVVRVIDALT